MVRETETEGLRHDCQQSTPAIPLQNATQPLLHMTVQCSSLLPLDFDIKPGSSSSLGEEDRRTVRNQLSTSHDIIPRSTHLIHDDFFSQIGVPRLRHCIRARQGPKRHMLPIWKQLRKYMRLSSQLLVSQLNLVSAPSYGISSLDKSTPVVPTALQSSSRTTRLRPRI
jgi:hypothetical protein